MQTFVRLSCLLFRCKSSQAHMQSMSVQVQVTHKLGSLRCHGSLLTPSGPQLNPQIDLDLRVLLLDSKLHPSPS